MADPKGMQVFAQMAAASPFGSMVGGMASGEQQTDMLGMDVMGMIRDMPLRTLFGFVGLSDEQMQGVLMMLNS